MREPSLLDESIVDTAGDTPTSLSAPLPSATTAEQPLLWGQWGGVIAIATVLAILVIGLTLTVGAVPL